jgi:hypothetical protein
MAFDNPEEVQAYINGLDFSLHPNNHFLHDEAERWKDAAVALLQITVGFLETHDYRIQMYRSGTKAAMQILIFAKALNQLIAGNHEPGLTVEQVEIARANRGLYTEMIQAVELCRRVG